MTERTAMFRTIGHTFELMKMSWRVLMMDRELILFPIMSGIALLLLVAAMLGVGGATGTLERVGEGSSESLGAIDAILGAAFVFVSSAIVIFFNAALIAAALERLRGGDPNIGSGLRAASARLPQILAWALITVIVSMILQALRERGGIAGSIASMIGGVAWGLATFFVIPVLVSEGVGPIEAIKRSAGLLRQTWGNQVTANFGFMIVGLLGVLVAIVPAALLFFVHPLLGIAVGVPLVAVAIGTVQALEGIFKAALYDYARGDQPHGFDRDTLASAYRAM
ncbi:MAG: hypothetical protein F4X26_03255 [Chloroflexi bacterium]|nr:hypothetical protein [Chloroflexota bacterium]